MREILHFYFSRKNEEGGMTYVIKHRFTGESIEVSGVTKDDKIQVHEDYVRNQSKLLKFAFAYTEFNRSVIIGFNKL